MRVLGPFYSGEVLPPFLVEQASSLQSKPLILVEQASHPCRASFILAEQASSLQSKSHPCRAIFLKRGGQVWTFVLSGAHVKDGLYLLWACGHGPVDMGLLGLPSLIPYFILFSSFTPFGPSLLCKRSIGVTVKTNNNDGPYSWG